VLEIVDVKPQPFVMLIEIDDGKIVKQNIYLNHKLYCEKFN
jgi:ketosteroid isomerase-like protein